MQDYSSALSSIKGEYSINSDYQLIAEWNGNLHRSPSVWGVGDGVAITMSVTDSGTSGTASGSTSSTNNAVRFAFKVSFKEPFDLAIRVTGKKDSKIVSRHSEIISITDSEKTQIVDFFSYNTDTSITSFDIEFLDSAGVLPYGDLDTGFIIDSLQYYLVSQSEAGNRYLLPIESVFSRRIGGEYAVDGHSLNDLNSSNVLPYNVVWEHLIAENDTNTGPTRARNFFPSKDSAFKYYIHKLSNSSPSVFVKYDSSFPTNKIVIKTSSAHETISSMNLSINGSAQTISGALSADQGLLVLYYNGTNWSTNKWAQIPKLVDGVVSGKIDVSSLKIEVTGWNITENSSKEFHLYEISPRLEVDLTSYVESIEVNKELSNDSLPLPIGISNSDSMNIKFSNIPDGSGSGQKIPFDNMSSDYKSTLYGLIDRDVKFKAYFIVNGSKIQVGTMYTNSWNSSFDMTSAASCSDIAKYLSMTPAPIFYEESAKPGSIIARLLDSVGCTDYDYNELIGISNSYIPYYWTVRGKSVLDSIQEIVVPYQIAMYIDELGKICFKSLSSIRGATTPSFELTDKFSSGYIPNIISYDEQIEARPREVSVGYYTVSPRNTTLREDGSTTGLYELVWSAPSEMLGYINNISTGPGSAMNEKGKTYQYEYLEYKRADGTSDMQSYSGYVVVGDEIIGFDGKMWKFTVTYKNPSTTPTEYQIVIKSQEQLEYYKRYFLSLPDAYIVTPLDLCRLVNLKRAMYGSKFNDDSFSNNVSNIKKAGGLTSPSASDTGFTLDSNAKVYFDDKISNNYSIYNVSFKPKAKPVSGKSNAINLIIGSANANMTNGLNVKLSITRKTLQKTDFYDTKLTIDGGTPKVLYAVNKDLSTKGDPNLNIMPDAENTMTVLLGKTSANADEYDLVSVFINGFPVDFGNETEIELTDKRDADEGKSDSVKFSAYKLTSKRNLDDKYFGLGNPGSTSINVNALSAIYTPESTNKLSIVASILSGNTFGFSNANELESVIYGRSMNDNYNGDSKVYQSNLVGRELRLFDIEYSLSPIKAAILNRYSSWISDGKNVTEIPPNAVTSSRFSSDVTHARFAVINSYDRPIFLNSETNSTSVGGQTTFISAVTLEPKDIKYIKSSDIYGSDSEVKMESEWIQSRSAAVDIHRDIKSMIKSKSSLFSAKIFGNPLLQIGDIISFTYDQKKVSIPKCVVTGISLGYNNGIETEIKFRRIP